MTEQQTLAEFLAARLEEDEAAALATTEHQPCDEWDAVGAGDHSDGALRNWMVVGIAQPRERTPSNKAIMQHIARHDPARVLREVAAKRAIIEEHPEGEDGYCGDDVALTGCKWQRWPCPDLRHLAAVYSDDEAYREEWRP